MNFIDKIRKEVMILDGSMGVFLQSEGLPSGYAPDLWNLERPELVASVHKKYVEAGSQIVITNTFGASKPRLAEYNAGSKVVEINRVAVSNARKGTDGKALVAGGLGPSGLMVAPIGEFKFDDAIEVFREQAQALVEANCDILIIETMFDLMEAKAAIIACNDVRKNIPLICSMTFTADSVTDTGSTPEAVVAVMDGLGVDVIGVNCSTGPDQMIDVITRIGEATDTPIMVEPNAGLPVMEKGVTLFKEPQENLAGFAPKFVELGANIIGGCCGTKPEYIKKVAELVRGKKPVTRKKAGGVVIASRSIALHIGAGFPFVRIGEKINPTGKKLFSASIKDGKMDKVLMTARKQTESGADALDVNVGVPMIDEPAMMEKAISAIQNVTPLPLVIDSSNNDALEAGVKLYAGRTLLNSVNAEPEKLERVLPFAKRYGCAVLALTAGEDIPESADRRIDYAKKILERALELGFRKEDIVFDCLAVVVSAMQEGARQTLYTIRRVKEELGCATSIGLSNSSFGLPDRGTINHTFLSMAMAEGLDGAIVNPYSDAMHKAVYTASIFTGRDNDCRNYIENATEPDKKESKEKSEKKTLTTKELLYNAILEGEKDSIQDLVHRGLDEKIDPMEMFIDIMTPGIRKLGELFAQKKKFIPHLVASADTMKKGMEILNPILKKQGSGKPKATIVFATVKGDVHDIGKNVCCIMLENFGFKVIDLGRSVPLEDIINTAKKESAEIIALSALMTTTMIQMPLVIDKVKQEKMNCKVMVGGAVVTKSFASEIGADAYGKDVGDVVAVAESLL